MPEEVKDWKAITPESLVVPTEHIRETFSEGVWKCSWITEKLCFGELHPDDKTIDLDPYKSAFATYRKVIGPAAVQQFDKDHRLGTPSAIFNAYLQAFSAGMDVNIRDCFKDLLQIGIAQPAKLNAHPAEWAKMHLIILINGNQHVVKSWVKSVTDRQDFSTPHKKVDEFAEFIRWNYWRAPKLIHMQPSGNSPFNISTAWEREDEAKTGELLQGLSKRFIEFLDIHLGRIVGNAHVEMAKTPNLIAADDRPRPWSNSSELPEFDDLLPLFPMRRFETDLRSQLSNATDSKPISLLFIDLDDFKTVNDTFGHLAGNEVLIGIATTLRGACDNKGLCYRWGGDELAVLLVNYTLQEAEVLAERVRSEIGRTEFKSYPYRVTVTIGVATFPETSESASDLIKDADEAALSAKKEGKNQVVMAKRPIPNVAGARQSRMTTTEAIGRIDAVCVTACIRQGIATSFLIDVQNESDEKVIVEEVEVFSNDNIRLTDPARPPENHSWQLAPRASLPISWHAHPDPAGALIKMNSQRGALFQTEVRIAVSIKVLGKQKRCESKLCVRVDAFQQKIIQLAG